MNIKELTPIKKFYDQKENMMKKLMQDDKTNKGIGNIIHN